MSPALRKLVVFVGLAALALTVLVLLKPVEPGPVAEASLASPGGISALPTAGPGIPGASDQALPAFIRARPPGNHALVSVFCDPLGIAPSPVGFNPDNFPNSCPVAGGGPGSGSITFEIVKLYPPDGMPAATFHATGTDTLVCKDNAGCDYSNTPALGGIRTEPDGVVVVQVDGGGENEILEVRATDEAGEVRAVQLVVIDTIMAFGPTGPVSTASQEDPLVVAYACDDIGRTPPPPPTQVVYERALGVGGPLFESADADLDGVVGLDDLWDLLYGRGSAFGIGILDNNALNDIDVPLYWCGGDTSSPLDNSVTFETDLGIFSIDPAAAEIPGTMADAAGQALAVAPFMDLDCDEGKSVEVTDVDSLSIWAEVLEQTAPGGPAELDLDGAPPAIEGGCDLDFAPNGVVSTLLLGTGETGTTDIKAQQGGGVSPVRTIYGIFVGEPAVSLFLTAPTVVGPEGGEFAAAYVDSSLRPIGGVTVECTVDPADGALMVVPATGTTGGLDTDNPGQVVMNLIPTGKAVAEGETLTLTCVVDDNRSVAGTAVVAVSSTPVTEAVDLITGCNPVVSTWADETAIETVAEAVAPAEALDGLWVLDPETGAYLGFSPAAEEVSDLTSLDRLDAFFVCVNALSTLTRPVI